MRHRIEEQCVASFTAALVENEKSAGTITQYRRSVEAFARWLGADIEFGKQEAVAYKTELFRKYKLSTANANIVALNSFFKIMG